MRALNLHLPPLLELDNVTVYRGNRPVFRDLSLQIPSGSHAAILGPNGSGKSTLLKLITRELYPVASARSKVRVMGLERWSIWDLRRQLGIVSHDLQQEYLGGAVGIQVVLSGFMASIGTWGHQRFTKIQRSRAANVLSTLGIPHLSDRRFDQMSTGEQRRCLLARALVHDPSTLVLDEPTSGLDLKACFQYLETLGRLIQEGKSVVIVTHHIHEIPPEVDQFILMKAGALAGQGTRNDLLTSVNLSSLFETPIRLVEENDVLFALPTSLRK